MLDSALCRPGRFDRLVRVGLPDEAARLAILKVRALSVLGRRLAPGHPPRVPTSHWHAPPLLGCFLFQVHAAKVCMASEARLESVAESSDGLSGADLANIVNEAALLAVRAHADVVTQECLEAALTKVVVAKARVH